MLIFQSLAKACPVEINHTLSQVYSPEMQCSNTEVSSINMHPLYCGFLVLTPWNELTGYVLLSLFRSEEIVAPKTVWPWAKFPHLRSSVLPSVQHVGLMGSDLLWLCLLLLESTFVGGLVLRPCGRWFTSGHCLLSLSYCPHSGVLSSLASSSLGILFSNFLAPNYLHFPNMFLSWILCSCSSICLWTFSLPGKLLFIFPYFKYTLWLY